MDCDCMTEDPDDGLGERVITHSLRCRLHPDYDGPKAVCPGSGMLAWETPRNRRTPAPKRGTCRRCEREFALTRDGHVRKHRLVTP